METPQLQSAAGDLHALVTVRKEDGALLASFADGGISLDRDVTVAAASTLNATTAGSTAATGAFSSNQRHRQPGGRQQPPPRSAAGALRPDRALIEGGAQGVLGNDTLLVNGAIGPEASLPYLFLSGGTTGLEMNTKLGDAGSGR